MKIIITGGAGFIASHVADAYVKAGHRVVIVDNLSSGSRKNINPRAKFHKADIRNGAALRTIFKKENPQIVNHHAALISVTASVKEPEKTFDINAKGTLNVLLALKESKAKHKKILFSSTGGAIYGNPKQLPADEHTPPNPFSPYALTKQIDEELIRYFSPAYGFDHLIFRYANVYGPRQKAQSGAGIFPIFISQIKKGIQPTIFGNGKKTRDYIFVEDVARASVLGLHKGNNETINIATAQEISDYEVFNAIAAACHFQKKAKFTPEREGEVNRISMSYAKAKKILGWEPKTSFAIGVQKTVQEF